MGNRERGWKAPTFHSRGSVVATAEEWVVNKERGDLFPNNFMKMYAIQWKSLVTGTSGTGTNRFEKEEAEQLAKELNEDYPDIKHEAVIPAPSTTVSMTEPTVLQSA